MSSPRYAFHVTLFAEPPGAGVGEDVELAGRSLATLALRSDELCEPMGVTFEQAEAVLGKLPRMFCEPDGSLVWRGTEDGRSWQVDGLLNDHQGRLLSVQLRGDCPPAEFDRLLTAVGWPEVSLVFQLVREGVILGEGEFRRWAVIAG